MSLRDEQRELTRRKILGAVLDLVAEGAMAELSVPMVAARSGASVATIYRYYPTKDALLSAAAEEPARRAGEELIALGDDGPAYLRTLWETFADHLDLVRHQVASDAGREMRDRRYPRSKAWFADSVARRGVDPDSEAGQRLVRLGLLLTSSVAFLDLHDRQGRTPDEAADDVEWAVGALTEATGTASPNAERRRTERRSMR